MGCDPSDPFSRGMTPDEILEKAREDGDTKTVQNILTIRELIQKLKEAENSKNS
jgi:hypothetical protein